MPVDRTLTRWNGWGWIKAHDPLVGRDQVWPWIAGALGVSELPLTPAKNLDEITLAASRLSGAARASLKVELRDDKFERAAHARGKSYHDLLHLRAGRLNDAPDAVVYPRSADEVVLALQWAAEHQVAVIPFAGGSSVVGGVTGARGNFAAAVALDLTLMNKFLAIDEVSMTATAEAGIYGVDLEAALGAKGYKLGHHPQSFEFSTLGGWIAARGAGQQSNAYGRAEKWFLGAEVATPKGLWRLPALPASAAGPDLRALIAGSEGAFGVICQATFRIHHVPAVSDYSAYLFADFSRGAAAIRAIVQAERPVATLRLSDADETYFFQAFGKAGAAPSFKDKLQAAYLNARGLGPRPCALILGLEGDAAMVGFARAASRAKIKAHGGVSAGRSPAERWYKGRFHGPYARDPMMEHGIGIDTLETATTWSNVGRLRDAVRGALDKAMRETSPVKGGHGIVMAHISHAYSDGASLYFTFLFPRDLKDDVAQWRTIKRAASDAIVQAGGTISHHHGVGEDHVPWLEAEKGAAGIGVLRAVKRELDPAGVMNPGKLLLRDGPKRPM